jgi:NitT/TauT family transport system permease protein
VSQIHDPTTPKIISQSAGTKARASLDRLADVLVIALLVTLAYGIVIAASHWAAPRAPGAVIDLSPALLPYYAGLSTLRMTLAYLLSLLFTFVYARIAARSRPAERVMIPALDILQSIPILSFLPGVVLALTALIPNSNAGLELAAVLLIFTSQAWNMAFSFYHSLLVIPKDMLEAATVYNLNSWRRFTRIELPFGMIPLVWNSMMSWAGGWFFLMAAEQFSLNGVSFALPGLGSYLQAAANEGDLGALALGLLTLVIVIILLDQFLWRPLIAWSDRFKIEQTTSGEAPGSWFLRLLRRSDLIDWTFEHVIHPGEERLDRALARLLPSSEPVRMALGSTLPEPDSETRATMDASRAIAWRQPLRRVAHLTLLVAVVGVCLWGAISAALLLAQVTPAEWGEVGVSALATLIRTIVALVIGVAWTVPVGVAIGLNPRLAQHAQPVIQVIASIPATALFPALLLLLLNLPGGLNIAAVALMLLGTQWYVLFNVIAGAMAIPNDLRQAAMIYKLRGWQLWRTLILPALFPYLVTGMITATGGAWNASVVSEYVSFNGQTYTTVGLGSLIASSAGSGNFALLLAATLTMAVVVVMINRFVWRRMLALAERRYHLD